MRTPSLRRGHATLRLRRVARLAAANASLTLVLGAFAVALAAPAYAGASGSQRSATTRQFVVDTTADGHDADPGDGICADTSGACTIRSAVEEADALGAAVTAIVPAGTYRLSLGSLIVTDPAGVHIEGTGTATTTVTAAGSSRDLVVREAGSGKNPFAGAIATLSQITIAGGSAPIGGDIDVVDANDTLVLDQVSVSGGHATDGGGIAAAGQISMMGSSISHDTATNEGGGVAASDVSVRVIASAFDGDVSRFGGGMFLQDCVTWLQQSTLATDVASSSVAASSGGGIYDTGPLNIVSDTFSSDTAKGLATESSYGGALYDAGGGVTVSGTTFSDDEATASTTGSASGGAIFAQGPLDVSDSFFRDDRTSGPGSDSGGAIYDKSFADIASSTFSSNEAEGKSRSSFGGAIYDAGNGADIQNTSFDGNIASNGNGGAIAGTGKGELLAHDTFTDNEATGAANGEGGALWAESAFTAEDSTFSQNHAQVLGGGIWENDSASLARTTVEQNTANQGAGIYVFWVLQATDSAFLDNSATGPDSMGGAILISGTHGHSRVHHVDLQYVTIAGNVALVGPGISDQAGKSQAAGGTIGDSVIASNLTPGGREEDCNIGGGSPPPLPFSSAGGNVVGDTTCALGQVTDRQGEMEQGYVEASSDGGVFNFGTQYYGSMGNRRLNAPVVAEAMRPGNQGYWEVADDGGVFAFGAAGYFGSMGARHLVAPVIGMASTPDAMGYWMVAKDGGVFSFGDASFYGSMGGRHLNAPIVAIARTPDGRGYWLVASDGGVFSFGDARFFGSTGTLRLNKPIIGLVVAPDGNGYTLFAADGGEFNFGTRYETTRLVSSSRIVSVAGTPDGLGYWVIASDGSVFALGDAEFRGPFRSLRLRAPVVSGSAT